MKDVGIGGRIILKRFLHKTKYKGTRVYSEVSESVAWSENCK